MLADRMVGFLMDATPNTRVDRVAHAHWQIAVGIDCISHREEKTSLSFPWGMQSSGTISQRRKD